MVALVLELKKERDGLRTKAGAKDAVEHGAADGAKASLADVTGASDKADDEQGADDKDSGDEQGDVAGSDEDDSGDVAGSEE